MNIIKSKKQMYLVIAAFALILLLGGTTYAFFNYTRVGGANTVSTGRISFNTSYPNGVITLNNVFPITSTQAQTDTTNAKTMTINITGDTDYNEGLEYLITLTDVHTTVNGKEIPIALEITPNNLGTGTTSFYADHSGYTTTNMYQVLYEGDLIDDSRILAGYIKPNNPTGTANGVNGSLTIKAYIDASRILITDTLVGTEPTTSPTPDYVNGTTNPDNKTVFTTDEWNSISGNNALSFKVKVESNEGKWIEAPIPTIESCPGCKFMYTTNTYQWGGANNPNATSVANITETVTLDYTTLNKNYFLGFTETQDGKIDSAFACGINAANNNTVFCIEGATDGSKFSSNVGIMNTSFPGCDASASGSNANCVGSVTADAYLNGPVYVLSGPNRCSVLPNGNLNCYEL